MQRSNFKIHDVKQGTDEWLALRVGKFTASQAPNVMGVGYGKTGEITPYLQAIFDKGHELEERARPLIEATRFNFGVLSTPTATCEVDGLELLASMDGYCDGIGWECKSYDYNNPSKDAQLMINGEIPIKHFWQMQHQMLVMDMPYVWLTSVSETDEGDLYTNKSIKCERDEEAIQTLVEAYKATLTADQDLEDLYHTYAEAKQEVDRATAMMKAIEADIKDKAKSLGAKTITGSDFKVSLIEKKGTVDYKSIPALKEVDIEAYRKPASSYYKISAIKSA